LPTVLPIITRLSGANQGVPTGLSGSSEQIPPQIDQVNCAICDYYDTVKVSGIRITHSSSFGSAFVTALKISRSREALCDSQQEFGIALNNLSSKQHTANRGDQKIRVFLFQFLQYRLNCLLTVPL
jgi:hypothetical protein